MRKSRLEGVRDLLNMTWTVGAGARMHHWLDLLPDQAFSPSAGAGGGGGGACPGEAVKPSSCRQPGRARQLAPTALAPQGWQAGPRLTLECLLGESLPAASCLEACLLPLLPAMAESRAWAGTCHKGSAVQQETHQWLAVTQAFTSRIWRYMWFRWSHSSASLSTQLVTTTRP